MRVGVAWVAVVAWLVLAPPPATALDFDAEDLEQTVVELLRPFLGDDVEDTVKSFVDIGEIGMNVVKLVNIISQLIFDVSLEDLNFGSYVPGADRKLLAMFEILSRRLDQMEHGIHGIATHLRDLADGVHDMVRWEIALDTMEEYARPVHTLHKRFIMYQQHKDKVEDHTLQDFANSVVSHDPQSVMSLMAHLHDMAAPLQAMRRASLMPAQALPPWNDPKDVYRVRDDVSRRLQQQQRLVLKTAKKEDLSLRPSLFVMLSNALKRSSTCSLEHSPQQLINGLYLLLQLTQARGFAMLEFSWMILRVYNEGNFTLEQQLAKDLYMQYSEDIAREAKTVLSDASRQYARCDPRTHVQGDTYVQFTELLQGYIENEVDLNKGGSCTQSCGYYQHASSEGCFMPDSQYCGKHRRCRGTVHDCRFYDADAWVCLSPNPYRRYDSIKYESGLRLGQSGDCQGTTMKVDSWWRFLVHCSYCLCLCDDPDSPSSDRYVSLAPALADTRNNMVVTGIKFTKHRRVVHIQVRQGQAMAQGQVNSSTIAWVDVEPIEINSPAYRDGEHYKTLSFEDRNIDLDDLTAPDDHVVTGVRLRMHGSHLNMEMQVTPINFTSGQLQPFRSYWISNDNTPIMAQNPRQELKLNEPDDPTRFPSLHRQDSKPDTFLRFGPTSRETDVAQLTVPFLDAQHVAPYPGSWLSGIELFHKGQRGSGGFLALRVTTYDVTKHMGPRDDEEEVVGLRLDVPSVPIV